ncbi:MAG: zinc-dependent metalloprotease, partial [Dolichospermum sp.]
VWALTVFILVFTFAIAIFKDIPDMEGDRVYNITTFTLQLGQQKVFNLALWVLTICYGGMILVGLFQLAEVNTITQLGQGVGLLANSITGANDVAIPLLKSDSGSHLIPQNITEWSEGLGIDSDQVAIYLALRESAAARLFAN